MKILSNKVWEAILDIARENDRKILELEAENKRLKRELNELKKENLKLKLLLHRNGISYLTTEVDFPATDKLHEDRIF